MLRKVFLSLSLVSIVFFSFAQSQSWIDSAPAKYLPKASKEIKSPDSACNQGYESFKDFLHNFIKSKDFRISRSKFENPEQGETDLEILEEWNDGFYIFKAFQNKKRCDKSYGTWYNVSENEVCFKYEDVLPCEDAGGSMMIARFQRINGKWFITNLFLAG